VGFILKTKTGKWPSSGLPVPEVGSPRTGKMLKGLVLDQKGGCPKVAEGQKNCHSNR
jgi:hypothetical protein